jgi:hypothetical protein
MFGSAWSSLLSAVPNPYAESWTLKAPPPSPSNSEYVMNFDVEYELISLTS